MYIGYVLDVANAWRGLLGLAPDPAYSAVAGALADLPIDPASPPETPLYTLNKLCVCMYLKVRVVSLRLESMSYVRFSGCDSRLPYYCYYCLF